MPSISCLPRSLAGESFSMRMTAVCQRSVHNLALQKVCSTLHVSQASASVLGRSSWR